MKNQSASFQIIAIVQFLGIGTIFTLFLTLGTGFMFMIAGSSGEQPTLVEMYESSSAAHVPVQSIRLKSNSELAPPSRWKLFPAVPGPTFVPRCN